MLSFSLISSKSVVAPPKSLEQTVTGTGPLMGSIFLFHIPLCVSVKDISGAIDNLRAFGHMSLH